MFPDYKAAVLSSTTPTLSAPAAAGTLLVKEPAGISKITALRAFLCLLCALLALPACSSSRQKSTPKWYVDSVETLGQQSLKEVEDTPAEFEVSASRDREVAPRLALFLKMYTKPTNNTARATDTATLTVYSALSKQGNFSYRIEKETRGDGITRYLIECAPKKTSKQARQAAELNTHNVARFLISGTLEKSLLAE
jgi:uncharacterized protein (DUF58 family)